MATTTVFTQLPDTYINLASPDTNYGNSLFLALRQDAGAHRRALIFCPRPVAGAAIASATLTITLRNSWSGSNTVTARRITSGWQEGRVTYNREPSSTSTNQGTGSVTGGVDLDKLDIDVTDIMQDVANGAANFYGFRLSLDGPVQRSFYSSESTPERRPYVTVVYTVPGAVPYDLRPDGGRAVSEVLPLLSWTSDTPSYVQVMYDTDSAELAVDTDGNPTGTPAYNSGWLSTALTHVDLSTAPAAPPLVDNTTYYWRVRIKDTSGQETGWSEIAELQRRSAGTLSITAPVADGNYVSETTPPIIWSFTGRTQTKYQALFYVDNELVYTSEAITSATNTWTVPAGYIKDTASTYKVTIRVWDQFDREGVGGDLPYVEATRTFVYQYTAALTEATNLVAATEGAHIVFSWNRDTAADYYTLLQDGEVVLDLIYPGDIIEAGQMEYRNPEQYRSAYPYQPPGSYAMNFYLAEPQVAHTYALQSVVDDGGVLKHSDTPPTVVHTFAPTLIWLVDDSDGVELPIAGKVVDNEIGETSAVFYPLSRQDPVQITDTVRGLEGSVSGDLVAYGTWTIDLAEAAFWELKARAAKSVFRLVYGYINIPVTVGPAKLTLRPTGEETYAVSFEYWQHAEFDIPAPGG